MKFVIMYELNWRVTKIDINSKMKIIEYLIVMAYISLYRS